MTETILPSNLLCAKTYARRGWAVFPVHSPRNGGTCSCGDPSCRAPGKHPRTATGLKEATTDPGKIQTWWDTWPDANIGVVTGRTEGAALLCVDIDPRHGGNDTLNALELTHGILPPHLIARTGGGGSHHIFSIPDGERIRSGSGKLGPGVDVKGEGGYFIAAPSLHVSGNRYEWVNLDPILGNKEHRPEDNLPPTWLLELLGNGRPSAPGAPPTGGGPSTIPEKITEGGRNDTLFRLSASLRAKGLGKEAIQAALLVENRARCQPPLPEDEVRSIAGSAGRYPPGALPPVSVEGEEEDAGERLLTQRCAMFTGSDDGNARRLVERSGRDLRYDHTARQWLIWDGVRWARDRSGRITDIGREVVLEIPAEARPLHEKEATDRLKWAAVSLGARAIGNMELLARSDRRIAVTGEMLDANPNLLNFQNGTLEVDTLFLKEHHREDLLTRMMGAVFSPVPCPRWLAHLALILGNDQELVDAFQMACGYALLADNPEQVIFILHGPGKNGKTTTIEVLLHVLGSYAASISPETLLVHRHPGGQPRADLVRLIGVRAGFSYEGRAGGRLDEAMIKAMTGGDRQAERDLYAPAHATEEFTLGLKIFFSTNHKPVIKGTDLAIWRRVLLWPFSVTIPENVRDVHIGDKLKAEAPGVAHWCLEGLRRYYENGSRLAIPDKVRAATDAYREESDDLGEFLSKYLQKGMISRQELLEDYRGECTLTGETPMSSKKFADAMRERPGIGEHKDRAGIRYWVGISRPGQETLGGGE